MLDTTHEVRPHCDLTSRFGLREAWKLLLAPDEISRQLRRSLPVALGFPLALFVGLNLWETHMGLPDNLGEFAVAALYGISSVAAVFYVARLRHMLAQLNTAQEEVRIGQEFLEETQRIAHMGHWILDLDSMCISRSRQWEQMIGAAPDSKTPLAEALKVVHLEDRSTVEAAIRDTIDNGNPYTLTFRVHRPDGELRWIEGRGQLEYDSEGKPVRLRGVNYDVTERVLGEQGRISLEAQLRQAQKMEAVGSLAGGIAHDFNNILYGIQGYGEMVLAELTPGSTVWEDQREVLNCTARASDLVRQILTFSRKSESKRVPVEISTIVKEVCKLMRATLPSTIEVVCDEVLAEAVTVADPVEIHQVLVNLCTNAAHAMGLNPGKLRIGLREFEVEDKALNLARGLKPGHFFLLSVSDTGTGISKENLERIFDPFFTTKDVNEGTGLGLSIVHGIVTGLGGAVSVYSEPGQGATFNIYLPKSEGSLSRQVAAQPRAGQERILFVDDEPHIARMGQRILEPLGYSVSVATSGQQALDLIKSAPNSFDLVITDLTMPQITGIMLAKELEALYPSLPVLLCSGFVKVMGEEVLPRTIKQTLAKPVSKSDLTRAIQECVSNSRVNAPKHGRASGF